MNKETRHVLIVAGVIGIAILAVLLAWGIDEMLQKRERSSERIEVKIDTEVADSAAVDSTDVGEVYVGEEVEETSPSTDSGAPSSPECTVSGNISGYGHYELVIHDSWGEISPGVPGKEGSLNDIDYNSSTGELNMSAYTESGDYCGSYSGYLTYSDGLYVYEGSFTNTSGRERSFVMTSR